MPNPILVEILKNLENPEDIWSLSQEEIDELLEQGRQRYGREIEAERGIPGQDPEEALRAGLPPEEEPQGELPVTAGLGVQEADMPEGMGAYTQPDVGEPVSDEQSQQWMEEREVYDAKYKLQSLIRESRDYRENLIDKEFGGLDPGLRNVQKLGKELAKMEVKTARSQLMEVIGKDDPEEMTPQERLALLSAEDQARRDAMTTVRQQKQDDTTTLQQAVGQFNVEQKAQMEFIEKRRAEIQELHMAQAEAKAKAEAEAAKPEMKPSAAMKRISQIDKAKATLEKANTITQALITLRPDLAGLIGQKIDPALKDELFNQWELEKNYLRQFIPAGFKGEGKPGPKAKGKVTHTFVPGKGLVPVK